MGDQAQFKLLESLDWKVTGPVLEVGAKDYGSGQPYRRWCEGRGLEYVGTDMSDGPNVDVVTNLIDPFEAVDEAMRGRRFGLLICCSVLEHCSRPHLMAENLVRLLQEDGVLYVSVPFAWKFHGYPSDYWRFTAEGIKVLFPSVDFTVIKEHDGSTGRLADIREHERVGRWKPTKLIRMMLKTSYLMRPTMIDMIGKRSS